MEQIRVDVSTNGGRRGPPLRYPSPNIQRDALRLRTHLAETIVAMGRQCRLDAATRFQVLNVDPDRAALQSDEALWRAGAIVANNPTLTRAAIEAAGCEFAAFFRAKLPTPKLCIVATTMAEQRAQNALDLEQLYAVAQQASLTVGDRERLLTAINQHIVALRQLREAVQHDQVMAKGRRS